MNKHKISILTPSYNQGQYLDECLDSVLSQRYENIELIVIDGGSTDESIKVLKKYDQHLAHWVSEKDKGQSDAINKGLKKASGEIINWLNSDDYLAPNSLKIINERFQNPETNIFSGTSNIVRDGEILKQSKGLDIYNGNLEKTIAWARIDQPETFWRRSALYKIGNINPNLHYVMDRDIWVRYLLNFGINFIEQSEDLIANFRLHDASKTVDQSSAFNEERDQYFSNLLDQNLREVSEKPQHNSTALTSSIDPAQQINWKKAKSHFNQLLALEAYARSDWNTFKKRLSEINLNHLSKVEEEELKKLASRVKMIPSFVHRMIKNR